MKKILIALTMLGFTYTGAEAQTKQIESCGVKHDKVCRMSSDRKTTSCYKTAYAENYKVCKGNSGYFICCEAPRYGNSTHPGFVVSAPAKRQGTETFYYNVQGKDQATQATAAIAANDLVAPESQSYPTNTTQFAMMNANSYEGYYPEKSRIKVCYTGSNVAELNAAPYHGCPSPQSEGPEVNKARNINANNASYDLPPVSGRSEE